MNNCKLRLINPVFFLLFFCFLSVSAFGQLGSAGGGSAGKTSKTKKPATKKPAKGKPAKNPTNEPSKTTVAFGIDDMIGTWRSFVTEEGMTYQVDVKYSREGTTSYFIRASNGRTARRNGGWSYSNDILYEQLSDGSKARGSVEWVDRDNLIITIIDNGEPQHRGTKRRYKRIE